MASAIQDPEVGCYANDLEERGCSMPPALNWTILPRNKDLGMRERRIRRWQRQNSAEGGVTDSGEWSLPAQALGPGI